MTGFHEVSRVPYWVNCGIYVLSRRGASSAFPGEGRSRDDDLPGARRRGLAARVPAHGALAHREHAEGAPPRRRARLAASGVARVTHAVLASTPRHVDKPWGYELIWAESETYVGKVLFVRAGQALSLQYHEQKDESWLVQSGRASLELGQVGGELETHRDRAGRLLPLPARHRASRHGARGHDDPRGVDTAPRRRRAARRPLRAARARRSEATLG